MFDRRAFDKDKAYKARLLAEDHTLKNEALNVLIQSEKFGYAYQWTWLGMPIIQLPQDIMVTQEIIWETKPTLIIETGIAWGGSVVFNAAQLSLIGNGRVIGIDKIITDEVKSEIMKFDFSDRITLIEGDSISDIVMDKIKSEINADDTIMVFLDSNHEEAHVLTELRHYSNFVTQNQYLNVYATAIDFLPKSQVNIRPWGPGSSPMTAVNKFLNETNDFSIDLQRDEKVLGSYIPQGRLLCERGENST